VGAKSANAKQLRSRRIVDGLVQQGKQVVVLGDLNEGPTAGGTQAPNLISLYDNNSPLVDCYSLPGFDVGNRLGTFDSCGLGNRLDYIFISKNLQPSFTAGGLFRKGLWAGGSPHPSTEHHPRGVARGLSEDDECIAAQHLAVEDAGSVEARGLDVAEQSHQLRHRSGARDAEMNPHGLGHGEVTSRRSRPRPSTGA
jgi:hypothetical protein